MKKLVILLVALFPLLTPSFAFASTLTCGADGGSGGVLFAFNTGYYGHACQFVAPGNMDVTAVAGDVDTLTNGPITFAFGVMADSSGKPSGSFLGSGNIAVNQNLCALQTSTFATTSLVSGTTYWLVAQPATHGTAYMCGAGTASTISDEDSSAVWSAGYAGGYHFVVTYATSSGGGEGGGSSSSTSGIGITLATSSATLVYDPSATIFDGLMLFLGAAALMTLILRQ